MATWVPSPHLKNSRVCVCVCVGVCVCVCVLVRQVTRCIRHAQRTCPTAHGHYRRYERVHMRDHTELCLSALVCSSCLPQRSLTVLRVAPLQKIVHEGSHTLHLQQSAVPVETATGEQLARMLFDYVGRYIYFPLKWGGAAAEQTWPNWWPQRREWPNGRYAPGAGAVSVGAQKAARPFFADVRSGWMWCEPLLRTTAGCCLYRVRAGLRCAGLTCAVCRLRACVCVQGAGAAARPHPVVLWWGSGEPVDPVALGHAQESDGGCGRHLPDRAAACAAAGTACVSKGRTACIKVAQRAELTQRVSAPGVVVSSAAGSVLLHCVHRHWAASRTASAAEGPKSVWAADEHEKRARGAVPTAQAREGLILDLAAFLSTSRSSVRA